MRHLTPKVCFNTHEAQHFDRVHKMLIEPPRTFALLNASAYGHLSAYESVLARKAGGMPLNATRILCIGQDRTLLASRCFILTNEGYYAKASNVDEGYQALQAGNFDLVIMSGSVARKHAELVFDCPVNTRSLVIEGFLFPSQLLAALRQELACLA
jgi:hypothetical protein